MELKRKDVIHYLLIWRCGELENPLVFRQYSRCKNITKKDCNSKNFHAIANHRRRKKVIASIKIGGEVVKGKNNIMGKFRNHFLKHFKQETLSFISLSKGSFREISTSKSCESDPLPSDKKIINAIKIWDVLENDVLMIVKSFSLTGKFSTSINTTWATLIPN